jgi:hypothetical protein
MAREHLKMEPLPFAEEAKAPSLPPSGLGLGPSPRGGPPEGTPIYSTFRT